MEEMGNISTKFLVIEFDSSGHVIEKEVNGNTVIH
jgi:hypothetical protein